MGNTFEAHYNSGVEFIRSEVELGPIPENPSDVSENDIKAIERYYTIHPDKFPSGEYIDVRDWDSWRNPKTRYDQKTGWTVSYTGFFKSEEVTETFDTRELAYDKLNELKKYNKQIALELIKEARNFALGLDDVETPWGDVIDVDAITISPEASATDNSVEQLPPEASSDNTEGEVVGDKIPPTEETIPGIPVEEVKDDGVTGGEPEVNQDTSQQAPEAENKDKVIEPLTSEQFERNKKLSGWPASYELAKIAKSQNIDLSILSREEYADFAIQNRLMIDDNQLRMSPWQRMCESPEEINQKLQEMRSLINPEAESDFDRFTNEMIQKAGEDNRSIDNEIAVRQGTKNSDHWLFFSINEGANIGDEQVFKSYASLKDLNLLTPDKFTNFMQALRDAGYNGDIKIFQDLMSQGLRLNDQIVMHGASEADAELGLSIADQFFGDSLADTSLGVDQKNQETGKYNSYSQVLAQKIKDSVQGKISNSEQQSQPNKEVKSLEVVLSRLVKEAANKTTSSHEEVGALAKVGESRYDGEVDTEYTINRMEIDLLKEKANDAINKYQEFHNSFRKEYRTPAIQEQYRRLEKEAWDKLEELAHKLGGRIIELPRGLEFNNVDDEDINPKTRDKLNSDLGYNFNQEGEITHIQINGNTIELNRPRSVDELLNGDRPARILYHSGNSILKDDDTKKHYKGYWIKGLNPHTVQGIETELSSNQFPIPDIIDDTIIPSDIIDDPNSIKYYESTEPPVDLSILNSTEPTIMPIFKVKDGGISDFNTQEQYSLEDKSKLDPWFEDSKVETEFNKMFVDSLKNKDEISGNIVTPDPWLERTEQPEVETVAIPQTNPDFGSLYYQEIKLWHNIQALENKQKENPRDELISSELEQAKQAYKSFRNVISTTPEQDEFKKFLELRESYANAEVENTRDRFKKFLRLKKNNNSELEDIRSQYNQALEALLKTETSIEVEGKIKEMFSDEVQRLSGERVVRTQEIKEQNQSGLDKRLNPIKDRLFNWYTKNKGTIGAINLGLSGTSAFLALTGAGLPLAGAVNTARHVLAYPMAAVSGVSSRESIRSIFEDLNTDLNLNIKNKKLTLKTNFNILRAKGSITKLVDKSLQAGYIQGASNEDLSKLVSTLESYRGLNGGKFTELNQQKAYEIGLNELGSRLETVRTQNLIEKPENESSSVDNLDYKFDFTNDKKFQIKTVDGLMSKISEDRISALNNQKNKRLFANAVGTVVGGSLLANLIINDLPTNKPSLNDNPDTRGDVGDTFNKQDTGASAPKTEAGSGTGGATTGESVTPKPTPGTGGLGEPPLEPKAPPTGAGGDALRESAEATRVAPEQAAQQAAEKLAQDVSSLDSGETISGEVAKQLKGATEAQIQQAVENYLQSEIGQNSIYELAQGTEGGRALLAQWGIDNATEMAGLSKAQLYEISRYLAPGELQGITELNLDNLTPFEAVEPPQVDVSEAMDTPTSTTEAPTPSVDPTPSAAPEAPVSPEVNAPTETTAFTQELSEILGKSNLTEIQARDMIQNYFLDDYGREAIYKSLTQNPEGAQFLSKGFGVNKSLDFASLTPEQMYEISQSIKPTDLEKIINESLLSKFEMADVVSLVEGDSPLGAVNRYIASEVGNLPYDSTLGQQVLNAYVQTPDGEEWLYNSIVKTPNPNNQNVQMFREYLRFEGIQSVEDFKQKFDWAKFSGNRRIPTSGFWNYTRLPNGNMRIAPLSTFLQPGKMVGIPEAIRQVLTKQ